MDVKVAIFGNGFARTVMLPCLRHVEGIELVGIASPNLERVKETAQQYGVPVAHTDHRQLLEQTTPDLVLVATPPHRHLDQTVDALDAGCHVICEKPTAVNADESAALWSAARRHPDRITIIDHELRLDPRRLALKHAIESGRLGQIHHATYTVYSHGMRSPQRPWSWWCDRDCGGGALGAIGSHAVDALRWLLGEVVAVRGELHTFIGQRHDPQSGEMRPVTSDDYAAAWLLFDSGARATVTISLIESERLHRLTLSGSRGGARLDEQQPLRFGQGDGSTEAVPIEEDLPSSEELEIPATDWARSFLRLARRVVAAIGSGQSRVDGLADFEDGHRNQVVLDAIRASSDEGRWIEIQ